MEIQGRIKQIFPSQMIGQNGFEKRDLVITTEEQYPQTIIIQFTQQRCDLLDSLQVGQNVKVYINIRGREWTNPQGETKYFNTIEGWKIEVIQTTNVANQQPIQQAPQGYGQAPQGYPQQQSPAPPPQRAPQQVQQPQLFDNHGREPNPAIFDNQEEDNLPF
nr:MAG TPA: Single-stranded DNA-binding protein fold, inter-subunit clamp, Paralogous.5A [Caudoviricetes sp.]